MGPKALRQMKAYVSRSFDELWPGAVMVGDGHTFKAETAHPVHGRPFRPEVTTIDDVYTRRICGWSVALAESTWDEFVQTINDAVETYNNRPHRSLPKIDDPVTGRRRHQSPNEVWNEAIEQGWKPDVVPEAVAMDLFRPHMIRRCNRCLVSVFSNEYFADALESYHGEDVQVFYDIHDPSKVWVRDREGRFITTAVWGGNKRSYVAVSAADAAREKRVAGKIRRLDEHRAVALAELSPSTLIEHQSNDVIALTAEQVAAATEIFAAMTAPQPAAEVVVLPSGRPRFDDDVSWIKWLTDHPAAVDADDRRAVRSVLSSSPTLRLQLEMAGVAAAAISELLSTESKVNIA